MTLKTWGVFWHQLSYLTSIATAEDKAPSDDEFAQSKKLYGHMEVVRNELKGSNLRAISEVVLLVLINIRRAGPAEAAVSMLAVITATGLYVLEKHCSFLSAAGGRRRWHATSRPR